ncbi:MAG: ABC transporter permease [Treponema sp.]|nr:ABC transporter permease [Treponema sp.]
MKKLWILFVASRYIFKGRSSSPVLAVLGIGIGVLALIVIIAVMNGFQLGFIESILEVSSYHLRLENFPNERINELQEIMLSIPGVNAAVPFNELQVLSRGRRANQHAVLVRGLRENSLQIDRAMEKILVFEEGSFDISNTRNVLLGTELARRLGLGIGDEVSFYSITEILSAQDEGGIADFIITGIFRTGYYEYDYSWAFLNIESISQLDSETDLKLGLKLSNRFHDNSALENAQRKLSDSGFNGFKLSSWRDYNRSFFGALRTEKLFMFILVGLIFIVVGLNIYQAQRRSVLQRREEIALMRAVGGNEKSVQLVFVIDGAVIGLTGSCSGLILGLFIASNIQMFFSLVETIVNFFVGLVNKAAFFLGAGIAGNFEIFSPTIFYLKEIPSRIINYEVVIIFMFGFLSSLAAAWFASRKVAKILPAEVLRYE